MPDRQLTTQDAALRQGELMITSLAASKLRFTKDPITLTDFTVKATLVAAEADFSGYTAGGYTLATWTGPAKNLEGGAVVSSPLVTVKIVDPDPDPIVGHSLTGWWIEDATGNVRQAGVFDPVRDMNVVADQFPFVEQIVFGRNPA